MKERILGSADQLILRIMGCKIGAEYADNFCLFRVWAPLAEKVEIITRGGAITALSKDELGYWETRLRGLDSRTDYKYLVDGKELPDPASRFQPKGVNSWSQVVPHFFPWNDDSWKGLSLSEMIIYELHVGTFTEEGNFDAIAKNLEYFIELGINTLEIMPVAQFPGTRNWGYDGTFPFAVQNCYGDPDSLKNLIDCCHQKGLAVLLDVVYNHLGPEGNYLSEFGPYFTDKYHTPWGNALNFDGEYSDEVRNFFLQNALMWLEEYHFDGLRLDAVHEIIDRGAHHFLQELSENLDQLESKTGRKYVLIAESDLNDSRLVKPYSEGGYGLEGQWVDDFHHSLHTCITGEDKGYYSDYGKLEDLVKTLQQGFVYDGIYSSFRKRAVGNSPASCSPSQFVVSIQNHDQVGNRVLGERLSNLVSFEAVKLAASLLLISPFVPMLFMGEEYAERNPFLYFVSHSDKNLVKAVQEGRKREFEYFFKGEANEFPDPQSEETFKASKLRRTFKKTPEQETIFNYYKHLIQLRRKGRFNAFLNSTYKVEPLAEDLIGLLGVENGSELFAILNLSNKERDLLLPENKTWTMILASADKKWGGTLEVENLKANKSKKKISPESVLVFQSQ